MEREVEYVVRLGLFDRYRHKHGRVRGKVVYFRIQYETLVVHGGKGDDTKEY